METSKLRRFDKAKLWKYPPKERKKKKKKKTSYQNGAVLAKIRVSVLTKTAPFRVGIKPKTPASLDSIKSHKLFAVCPPLSLVIRPPLSLKKIPTIH
jgi:hypothetical protein